MMLAYEVKDCYTLYAQALAGSQGQGSHARKIGFRRGPESHLSGGLRYSQISLLSNIGHEFGRESYYQHCPTE